MAAAHAPLRTPSPSRHKAKPLVDSPFSDYYTDTSPQLSPAARFASPFQQKLLTRLNRIGTQVLQRPLSDDASKDIEVGLDALENRIQAPEVKSRESADVADSGLFVDEDDDGSDGDGDDVYDSQDDSDNAAQEEMAWSRDGLGMRMSHSPEEEFLESPLGSVQSYLADKVVMEAEEAEALVKRVSHIASELRQRYGEAKHLNDQMVNRLETASNEVLHLRSENEALRADLSFDHSELLFLKLQLKAVQLSMEPQLPADGQYTSSVSKSLSDGLERWKKDWRDVDLKFHARRAKYGLADVSAELSKHEATASAGGPDSHAVGQKLPVDEVRLPTRIVSIRRPAAPRSFTAPPPKNISPLPAEPPTPSLTSSSESGDDPDGQHDEQHDDDDDDHDGDEVNSEEEEEDGYDVETGNPLQKLRTGDSVAITTSDEHTDDSDEESDGSVEWEDDEEDAASLGSDHDDATVSTSRPRKTPWQELWDGLTEIAGMTPDED